MNWLVKGAHIVSPADGLDGQADLLVVEGRVSKVGSDLVAGGAEIMEANGLLLLPGLVDLHAHFGEPGLEQRETLVTGSAAACRGGYTTVLMMPDTLPPLDTPAAVAGAVARSTQAVVRVRVAGALTQALAGEAMPELAGMAEAGAMAFVQPDGPVSDAGLFRHILQYARGLVPLIAVQPHEPALMADGLMHEGVAATIYGIKGIPAVAEEVAVARDLLLAAETGCPLHLSRISTAKSLQLVTQAKAAGVRVTCDVGPHHLVLTDACLETYDPTCKLMPPLRPSADVRALVAGLASGAIDCVATDHTPFTAEEKDVEFALAPWGAVGLETTLPLLFTHLVVPGDISMSQLVRALSVQPACLLGLGDDAGTLAPGKPADFVLMDPALERLVEPKALASRGKNTPLAGRALRGWPVATFVGGHCVWRDGRW